MEKDPSDPTDTAQKADVDTDAASRSGSLPGNVGKNPNATPDASTSGANSPKR